MATIQLGGLATGLDTSALINQLMSVEQQPIAALQTKKTQLQGISAAFQDLNSKLLAVKAQADALADPATVFPRSITSSDDGVVTATAGAGAARGTYSLTVSALARGSIATASQTKGALTDVVASGAGSFQFKLGTDGDVVSVPVDGSTTLTGLVKAINDQNAGVRAAAINVGTAAAPAYKLTLTSTGTGAASNIAIVSDGTTLGVANSQAAQDAAFSIAGIGTFSRATNSFSDVLDGVTITLKASSGTSDLVVAIDGAGLQSSVSALIARYNTVVQTIDGGSQLATDSSGAQQAGPFTGDVVPQMIRRGLASAIASAVPGALGSLSRLGITTQKDGTLALDAAAFQRALAADPQAVSDLIAGTDTHDGVADILSDKLAAMTKDVTGSIAVREDGLTTQVADIGKQIDAAQNRLDTTRQMLQEKFTNLELVVSQIQSTGNSLLSQLQSLQTRTSNSQRS